MATATATAHVVVIDSAARRATIKTSPNKYLSDVLEEACGKLGLKASNYGLKNNNKPVDLSRTFRLSGLLSGAKLELVQLSKSAGVIDVALQLPPEEAAGVPNARLIDKFPSSTTLWQILRRFEEGVAGGSSKRNLTQRGAPSTSGGAGRLFYQQPLLHVMSRELSSLTDLNKTLAQLGYNSGRVLIKLSFTLSDIPLEEAATQIAHYFMSVDQENKLPTTDTALESVIDGPAQPPDPEKPEWTHDNEPESIQAPSPESTEPQPVSNGTESDPSSSTLSSRPLSVYRPPTSSTPSASLITHDEADYTPTVEHAQVHQKLLNESSRNKRLPTEAEIVAAEQAEKEKLAAIKDVEIKIRFPDQSQVSAKFTQIDTGNTLYTEVRQWLEPKYATEPFVLRDPSNRVKGDILTIPDNEKKLIQQLGLKGRLLLVFSWGDAASSNARGAGSPLKLELRAKGVDIPINDVSSSFNKDDDRGIKVNVGKQEEKEVEGSGIVKKMPKWLKGLNKK